MNFLNNRINAFVKSALQKHQISHENLKIEINKNISFGHYSTNFAFLNWNKYSNNLNEFLEYLVNIFLEKNKNETLFAKVEYSKNGFINFFLTENLFIECLNLNNTNKKKKFSNLPCKKINLEFVSANPTGFLHIGHARIAVIGKCLVNIAKSLNYKISSWYYVNNAGNQMVNLAKSLEFNYNQIFDISKNAKFTTEEKEEFYKGKEIDYAIKELLDNKKNLKEWNEDDFKTAGENFFLQEIKKDLKNLNIHFDKWIFENKLQKKIKILKKELEEKQLLYFSENAWWVKTSEWGDDKDRVFQKADNTYTYFVVDCILHIEKLKHNYDEIINLFGADHIGYFKRIQSLLKALNYNTKVFHTNYVQLVRLIANNKEIKMSKRAGTSYWMRDLIKEVGADRMKFYLVSQVCTSTLDFDIDFSKNNSSSNPFYYTQYAHARCNQLILKAKKHKKFTENCWENFSIYEISLILNLSELENILLKAWDKKEPHYIYTYLNQLAKLFHAFYRNDNLLVNNKSTFKRRLQIIKWSKKTFKYLFNILSIEALNVL